jgi:hypothetical protein
VVQDLRANLQQREMPMFELWFAVAMLALESSDVIGLRVAELAHGGVDAQSEAHLLVNEKIVAVFDTSMRLARGAITGQVIDNFRKQAAANACRLPKAHRYKSFIIDARCAGNMCTHGLVRAVCSENPKARFSLPIGAYMILEEAICESLVEPNSSVGPITYGVEWRQKSSTK